MRNEKTCPHCDPFKAHPLHFGERISNTTSFLAELFLSKKNISLLPKNLHSNIYKISVRSIIHALFFLKIFQEKKVADLDNQIHNRSLVLIQEADRRGISVRSIKLLGKINTGLFSIVINGQKIFFDGLPYEVIDRKGTRDFNDKDVLKKILSNQQIPYPRGGVFKNYNEAVHYTEKIIGFPVVVKPRFGSLSRHTVCNIKTREGLKEAVRIVKLISREFIVEEFIQGDVYRATVVGGNVVAVCRREPPNVIGDGTHTIRELVEIKNAHPWRGEKHQKNFTLHKISLSKETNTFLAQRNIDVRYFPQKGEKVYLHSKVVLSAGADTHDVTDKIHADNIVLLKNVYKLCELPVIGVDFIIPDITKSFVSQKSGIVEVNSLPYIDMHHYPATGQPRNVAGHILDYCVSNEYLF